MSNFALRPINLEIRKKLLQKQRAFARYNTDTDQKAIASTPVNDEEMVQFFNRTTWAHLISLSVIESTDEKSRLAIIGGGELEQDPGGKDVANKPLMRTSFEDIYRPFRDDNSSTLIKPISGIKSISTRFEGTLKSRREATVQFTIFSLEDLDRLSPHFFRVGGEVLLEFGWNSDKYDFSNTLGNQIITTYHNKGISSLEGISSIDLLRNNTAENYEKSILDLKGDYEYVLGTIKNFDYSLRDDGGFDCTVVVSTVGMSLLDSKVNREESPSQILQQQLHIEDEKATDKPHTTFYHVIENLPEIMTYSIINNYINTNGNLSRDEVSASESSDSSTSSTLSGEGPVGIDLNNSGYILSNDAFSNWYEKTSTSESGLLTETIEKFKKVAEAKSLQEWMEFKDINTDDIYYHNYYTNETVMIGISNPALEGNSDIFQEIYDRAKSMEEGLSGLDAPDEDEKESESFRTYGDGFSEKIDDDNEIIFISYNQGDTVQAFTGFKWDKRAKFDELAKPFCEKMFTGGGDPDIIEEQKFDETLGKEGTDSFLDGFVEGSLPSTWIRWGWFEDNVITKYLGFESVDSPVTNENPTPLGKPVSIFKSVEPKVNKETGDIIPGYESNIMTLPAKLKTTDVNEIIIPDRCKTLDKLSDISSIGEGILLDAKFYGTLGTILENGIGKTAKIYPVEIDYKKNRNEEKDPSKRMGYIRNLFVEVDVLKESFLNVGSLREGIENFFGVMRRNFGPLHDFEVQAGKDEGMVGIVDNNLLYSLGLYTKPKTSSDININKLSMNMEVYEFPAWEKESIVKSQDLKVSIPDSMAITALYAGNEYEANMFNYDKGIGSLKVQKLAKFLKLDETGNAPRKKSLGSKSKMRPLFESKNFVSSGNGINEKGMIKYQHSGDFYKSLSDVSRTILASRGVDEPSYSDYEVGKVKSSGGKLEGPWENGEMSGWYNPTGRLGDPISYGEDKGTNYRVAMEYDLEFDIFTQVTGNFSALNGLMSLGLTIDGTAGIFPGNSYISKYLPIAFEKRTDGKSAGEYPLIFQATNIEHEINPSGWNTTITGMPRLNNRAFPEFKLDDESVDEYMDEYDGSPSDLVRDEDAITDGLSGFLNIFNLNGDFANQAIKNIIGINTSVVGGDDTETWAPNADDIGSFANIMNFEYDMKQEALIKKASWERGSGASFQQSLKDSDPGYADYTDFYNALSEGSNLRTVPERLPKDAKYERAKRGGLGGVTLIANLFNDKVSGPPETVYNPLEMMLFLQISSVITGISYNSMKVKFGHGSDYDQRTFAPPTVSRVFYSQALADIMDWPSNRPKGLMNNTKARLIGEFLINPDNIGKKEPTTEIYYGQLEKQEKEAVYEYFGVGHSDKIVGTDQLRDEFTWSKEMWGKDTPGRGNNFTSDDLARGLLYSYGGSSDYNIFEPTPTISTWMTDPISGDEVDDKYILIGPIHAGVPTTINEQYAEFTIAFWNIVFAAILKNELGIPTIAGVSGEWAIRTPNWNVFDKKLLELYNNSKEGDAIRNLDVGHIETLVSKNIFEHALKCQYLINNPSP